MCTPSDNVFSIWALKYLKNFSGTVLLSGELGSEASISSSIIKEPFVPVWLVISKVKDESDALSINAETEPFKLPLLGNLFTKSLCFVVTTLVLVNLSTEPVAM